MRKNFLKIGLSLSLICFIVLFSYQYHNLKNKLSSNLITELPTLISIQDESVPLASGITDSFIPCTVGLLTYYPQTDVRWNQHSSTTVSAMLITSYTGTKVNPAQLAQWITEQGYNLEEVSHESLIINSLDHFGLSAVPLSNATQQSVVETIERGKIIIAQMKNGYFSTEPHFLLLTQVTEQNKLRIADPGSLDNSQQHWDIPFVFDELAINTKGDYSLWAVSMPPEI